MFNFQISNTVAIDENFFARIESRIDKTDRQARIQSELIGAALNHKL